MKIFDWLPLLRRHSGAGCACTAPASHDPAATDIRGRARPRMRLAMAREAWVIALAQRLCVDMPLLIDSLPNELIRVSLMGRDEVRHD
jgi:hypothetical protein